MEKQSTAFKTLLVLRHGKSSWKDLSLDDHDRPLKKRGRHDAARMGAFLGERELIPDLVLTSSAERARVTVQHFLEGGGFEAQIPVRVSRPLYHAKPKEIVAVLQGVEDTYTCVMVVGHNPGLEDLVELLVGAWHRLPTAALAEIRLPISSWRDFGPKTRGELRHLWCPADLDG
ncbi:MAG: SixA phosphatase family protein [Anaerolineae bacterium]